MKSEKSVFRGRIRIEVEEEYQRMVKSSADINTGALVSAIVHRHMPSIYQMTDYDEAELFVGSMHYGAWEIAVEYMNKVTNELDRDAHDRVGGQMRFVGGGFESEVLQDRYAIKRKNERVHVFLKSMTDLEIEAKAQELETQARGLVRHAAELRRYISWRCHERDAG